jgi:hypothetical protein
MPLNELDKTLLAYRDELIDLTTKTETIYAELREVEEKLEAAPKLALQRVYNSLGFAKAQLKIASEVLESAARANAEVAAFDAFTVAKLDTYTSSYLGFGSAIVYTNDVTFFVVIGLLDAHSDWQRGRLRSGLLGGWKLYRSYAEAVDAANDEYGGA